MFPVLLERSRFISSLPKRHTYKGTSFLVFICFLLKGERIFINFNVIFFKFIFLVFLVAGSRTSVTWKLSGGLGSYMQFGK